MAKYLSLAMFVYNAFKTPNLGNHSPYELISGRKPRSLLSLDSTPDIKVSGTFREYYDLLNKRIKYLHNLLLNFKPKRLAMVNKDRAFFQYNIRDFTTYKPIEHYFNEGHNKICRSTSYL